ncbi:sugar kinase (plasmid) [Embleya sp. NBC_00888]|uniref:sugar kinase n=1 Tax=Embleya sp. NBC_00888 TaxID=2975960 RepID=UPI00386A899A|nr:sugar kinase [Embleya sp. NBC_00888]
MSTRFTATEVVTLGEAMSLLLAEGTDPLADAIRFERSVAGAESNVAVGLARLGHSVAYIGRVGDDAFGTGVRRALRGEGVDTTGLLVDAELPTGLLVRDAPAGRPVTVLYHRSGSAGAALRASDVPRERIASARLLHLTGITAMLSPSAREAVVEAARTAVAHGVPVFFDPNLRLRLAPLQSWREVCDDLIPLADTVLVGADELDLLELDAADLSARGVRTVVVKDGANGAWAVEGDTVERTPARQVPTVDPVGAGDAFAAGWISAALRDLTLRQRLCEAAVVASCVVAARGDITGLPDSSTRDRLGGSHQDVLR